MLDSRILNKIVKLIVIMKYSLLIISLLLTSTVYAALGNITLINNAKNSVYVTYTICSQTLQAQPSEKGNKYIQLDDMSCDANSQKISIEPSKQHNIQLKNAPLKIPESGIYTQEILSILKIEKNISEFKPVTYPMWGSKPEPDGSTSLALMSNTEAIPRIVLLFNDFGIADFLNVAVKPSTTSQLPATS